MQDDAFALDWGNWIFSERNLVSTSCDLESACPPIYEGSIKSLQFDNFLNVSHPVGTSLCQNEGSSDHCPIQLEEVSLPWYICFFLQFSLHKILVLFDVAHDHRKILQDHEVDIKSFSEQAGSVKNSDVPEQRWGLSIFCGLNGFWSSFAYLSIIWS